MKTMPNVAVIITCHNYKNFVGDAIKSVVDQDYPHDKLIIAVCDDGSDDDSPSVIKSYINNQKTTDDIIHGYIQDIKAIFIQNTVAKKQAYARNQLIKAIWNVSDLFCILDSDDKYMPNKVSRSIEVYLKDPETIGAVYSDLLIHNLQTGVKIEELRQSYDHTSLQYSCITSNAPLLSKKALAQRGLYYDIETPPCEDYLLMLALSNSHILIHVPELLSEYRITGKNATITTPKEVLVQKHRLLREKLAGRVPFKYD